MPPEKDKLGIHSQDLGWTGEVQPFEAYPVDCDPQEIDGQISYLAKPGSPRIKTQLIFAGEVKVVDINALLVARLSNFERKGICIKHKDIKYFYPTE